MSNRGKIFSVIPLSPENVLNNSKLACTSIYSDRIECKKESLLRRDKQYNSCMDPFAPTASFRRATTIEMESFFKWKYRHDEKILRIHSIDEQNNKSNKMEIRTRSVVNGVYAMCM